MERGMSTVEGVLMAGGRRGWYVGFRKYVFYFSFFFSEKRAFLLLFLIIYFLIIFLDPNATCPLLISRHATSHASAIHLIDCKKKV